MAPWPTPWIRHWRVLVICCASSVTVCVAMFLTLSLRIYLYLFVYVCLPDWQIYLFNDIKTCCFTPDTSLCREIVWVPCKQEVLFSFRGMGKSIGVVWQAYSNLIRLQILPRERPVLEKSGPIKVDAHESCIQSAFLFSLLISAAFNNKILSNSLCSLRFIFVSCSFGTVNCYRYRKEEIN